MFVSVKVSANITERNYGLNVRHHIHYIHPGKKKIQFSTFVTAFKHINHKAYGDGLVNALWHHLFVVLIEDQQVVVGVCVNECLCVASVCDFNVTNKQTNSKPMHASKSICSKPNKQIKNNVAYSLQILSFLFKTCV